MDPTRVSVVFVVSCLTFVSSASLGDIFSAARRFKRQTVIPLHQLPVMRRTFSTMFDTSGDGVISATEMQTALATQGQTYSDEMMNMIMSQMDKDGDGVIDFSEFLAMQGFKEAEPSGHGGNGQQNQANAHRNDPAYQTFSLIDQDKDGYIIGTEMKAVMAALGNSLSDDQILTIITMADKNGDGKIDFEEFKASNGPRAGHGPQ